MEIKRLNRQPTVNIIRLEVRNNLQIIARRCKSNNDPKNR